MQIGMNTGKKREKFARLLQLRLVQTIRQREGNLGEIILRFQP